MPAISWRLYSGPLMTVAFGAALFVLGRLMVPIPIPGVILFFPVLFAAYVGGTAPGLISALLALGFAALSYADPGQNLIFGTDPSTRLLLLAIVLFATAFLIGAAQDRARRSRREIEGAAQATREISMALDAANFGVILLDRDLKARFMNRAFCKMWDYPLEKAASNPDFVSLAQHGRDRRLLKLRPEDRDFFADLRIAAVREGDPMPLEVNMANGRVIRIRCSVLPDDGRMLTYTDVTEAARRNDELEALRSAVDQVRYGVMLLDRDLRAQFINRAFRAMAEFSDEFADSKPTFIEILQHGRATNAYAAPNGDVEAFIARRLELVRQGTKEPVELRWSRGRVVRNEITPLPGGGRMLTYHDITDLANTAEELERLATTDALTGLINRRQFFALTEREWSRVQRYERPLSLLMLDIDAFKSINDRFGHEVGDDVLMRTAAVMREAKRDSDIIARIGGEEFALLLPETDLPGAALFAERLRVACNKIHVLPDRRDRAISVSIGVAEADPRMSGFDELMRRADEALYAAKRAGRNRYQCAPQFGPEQPGAGEHYGVAAQVLARKH
jgi:diguanylate cyclase (GGDEF)-like protein